MESESFDREALRAVMTRAPELVDVPADEWDIAPLAGEVNLLLETNREILERARTQVGNLAHALKTPLSIIVNEASAGDANSELAALRDERDLIRTRVGEMLQQLEGL